MLKIVFDFVSSLQFVDAVIFQINYAVDGLTNGCTKKQWRCLSVFSVTLWKKFHNFLKNMCFPTGMFFLHRFMKNINRSLEQHHITLSNM